MIDEIEHNAIDKEPVERWISFYLGEECYAVELKRVREILRISHILPVPGTPEHVLGITNIRGSVVTVINGRNRTGLPDREQDDLSRMIILELDEEVIGMVVDKVYDVITIPASQINPNPKVNAHQGEKYIKGVYQANDKLVIIIDIDRFMSIGAVDAMAVGF